MSTLRRPLRIHDPVLGEAAGRLDSFTRMLGKRLDELAAAPDRRDKTLAILEAEVAANLVESAVYEITLRLLGHGVPLDAVQEVDRRLARYRDASAAFETSYGPVPRA